MVFDYLTSSRPDRTPGYDPVDVASKMKALSSSFQSAVGVESTPPATDPVPPGVAEPASPVAEEVARRDNRIVTAKQKYMSRGIDKCRILQRMDDSGRPCKLYTKIMEGYVTRVHCSVQSTEPNK
jgi:hypothetical protein